MVTHTVQIKECHTDIRFDTDVKNGTFDFLSPQYLYDFKTAEECRNECDKEDNCTAWSKEKEPGRRCWLSKQGGTVEFQPKMNRDAGRKICTI